MNAHSLSREGWADAIIDLLPLVAVGPEHRWAINDEGSIRIVDCQTCPIVRLVKKINPVYDGPGLAALSAIRKGLRIPVKREVDNPLYGAIREITRAVDCKPTYLRKELRVLRRRILVALEMRAC